MELARHLHRIGVWIAMLWSQQSGPPTRPRHGSHLLAKRIRVSLRLYDQRVAELCMLDPRLIDLFAPEQIDKLIGGNISAMNGLDALYKVYRNPDRIVRIFYRFVDDAGALRATLISFFEIISHCERQNYLTVTGVATPPNIAEQLRHMLAQCWAEYLLIACPGRFEPSKLARDLESTLKDWPLRQP